MPLLDEVSNDSEQLLKQIAFKLDMISLVDDLLIAKELGVSKEYLYDKKARLSSECQELQLQLAILCQHEQVHNGSGWVS